MDEQYDEGPDELEHILQVAGRLVARGTEPAEFLDWFQTTIPTLAPQFSGALSDADSGSGSLIYSFGRSLWNAMPQPSNRYQPRRLPKPNRNGRCPCGSGRKFKQCCAHVEPPDELFESLNLLRYVLDSESMANLKRIDARSMNPEALADVAQQWASDGDFERALVLLEPLFDAGAKLPRHAELLLDILFDIWPPEYKPQRRRRLAERLAASSHSEIACVALHRCIVMLADEGKKEDAWARFHEGMRRYPEDVNFAGLEITLLLNENRMEDAKRRAEFWSHQLRRKGPEFYSYADRLVAMAESREDHESLELLRSESPLIDRLAQLIEAEPISIDDYEARPTDVDEPIMLIPSSKLATTERRWAESVGGGKPSLVMLDSDDEPLALEHIISLLEEDSSRVHSFDVLDDISESLEAWTDVMPELGALFELVLQRAETMLYSIIVAEVPDTWVTADTWRDVLPRIVHELPWAFLENRPALRLVVRHIHYLKYDSVGRVELWLPRAKVLLKINPNDNHGYREMVSTELLRQGKANDALTVLNEYPDDALGAVCMNRVLALFLLERHAEAEDHLREGGTRLREMRKGITQQRYAKPRDLREFSITMGGRDEAWIYRQDMHETWNDVGASDWLKQQPMPRKSRQRKDKMNDSKAQEEQTGTAFPMSDESSSSMAPRKDFPAGPLLLTCQALQNVMDELAPQAEWMLGLALAAALTPGDQFDVNRLIKPVLERFSSGSEQQADSLGASSVTAEEISNRSAPTEFDLDSADGIRQLNRVLDQFLRLYHHFLIRLGIVDDSSLDAQAVIANDTDNKARAESSCDWVHDDLSVVSSQTPEARHALVSGLVASIDGNPRGWSSIPTGPRNSVIGPLRLMVASADAEHGSADSALSNLSFLNPDDNTFQMDRQQCVEAIIELVQLARMSRR